MPLGSKLISEATHDQDFQLSKHFVKFTGARSVHIHAHVQCSPFRHHNTEADTTSTHTTSSLKTHEEHAHTVL